MPYVVTVLAGLSAGGLAPPRTMVRYRVGSTRCSAVDTSETKVAPSCADWLYASIENCGAVTTDVPITRERSTTDSPPT